MIGATIEVRGFGRVYGKRQVFIGEGSGTQEAVWTPEIKVEREDQNNTP